MIPDLSPFFQEYEKLVAEIDGVVERVGEQHSECVNCGKGCSDCCYAMFDLTLVEAMYLNAKFAESFSGQNRSDLLDRADEADRKGYRIKRKAFQMSREGARTTEILEYIGSARLRCPLLGEDDLCAMYEHRPLTCRLYGIPTAIRGQAHTCSKSGFKQGEQYPTVQMEKLQDRLLALSARLVGSLRTRYARLGETLVPVSMALMNKYDDDYLGIMTDEQWEKAEALRKTLVQSAQEVGDARRAEAAAPVPGAAAEKAFGQGPVKSDCSTCGEAQGSDACSTCGTMNWEIGGGQK